MSFPRPLRSVPWKRWLFITAWLVLGLYYVVPIIKVLDPGLDSSIRATYAHFTAHGFQFGAEVNTTAGPYGFAMYGWDYSGELFWPRYALVILFSFALAALVLWFVLAARNTPVRWVWLVAVILGIEYGDNQFNLSILLCGLYLLLNFDRPERRVATVLVAVFLACLSLMKGTQLAVSFGVIGITFGLALVQRAWRSAAWLAASYGFALLGWWVLAGQNPLNLPLYIDRLRHIAQGYNEAMALNESIGLFRTGVSLLIVLLMLLALLGWRHRRNARGFAACLMVGGITGVAWKHGYVRADGHTFVFLDLGCILALTLVVLNEGAWFGSGQPNKSPRYAVWPLAGLAVALGLWGGEMLNTGRFRSLLLNISPRFARNAEYVFSPRAVRQQRDAELLDRRNTHASAYLRQTVGDASIDFYGHDMGLLLLNGLNYQPAPMCCGSYHVYNRTFKELNFRHFADPQTRPEFVLLKIQSIDQRLVAGDDSLSLLSFLDLYRPVVFEHDSVLLKALPSAPSPQTPREILSKKIQFDEFVVVPDVGPEELVLVSIDLPSSARGSLRAFAYKPPLVFMELAGIGLTEPVKRRVIPSSIAITSLLSPALEKTDDFIALFDRGMDKTIRHFRLQTEAPDCFRESDLTVTFSVIQRPVALSQEEIRRIYLSSVYQDPPDEIDPPNATVDYYNNVRVQYLHTPASFTYQLRGDERRFSMTVGIDEKAYVDGQTDGVDFQIQLVEPGEPRKLLLRRYLQPRTQPADRGTHRLVAALPPAFSAGSQLIIRADPGPNRDASWDWAFATDIRFARTDFVAEQFPGFKTLPVSCDGKSVSPHNTGSRDIVMVAAPGGMTFALNGDETELRFTGGLIEASYTTGNTDGAAFVVEYEFADGTTQRVFSRLLQPKTHLADRDDQEFSIPLPPAAPGARLRLLTDPGPNGDIAFDWVYLSALELR